MALADAWTKAPEGKLPPCEQVKLLGLRWALKKLKQDEHQHTWMSEQVNVVGPNGKLNGGHPTKQAVSQFFERVDEVGEKNWYLGMRSPDVGRPIACT